MTLILYVFNIFKEIVLSQSVSNESDIQKYENPKECEDSHNSEPESLLESEPKSLLGSEPKSTLESEPESLLEPEILNTENSQVGSMLFTIKATIVVMVYVIPKFSYVIIIVNSNPKIKTQTKQAEMLNQKSVVASASQTILTDNDLSIANAIHFALTDKYNTKHSLCIWHMLKNIRSNMTSKIGSKYNEFHANLIKCLDHCIKQSKFEKQWSSIMFNKNYAKA
ncbi:5368_t:CDS:2, partial [Dentiscutata heterogama]